ncbi:hypothetical protein FDP41_003729 [Naegleria fowleri]|uniref:SUEL-type lectin domain-containing protein n=1 Tax=Naegleria fowleri TaxID=5763 RepID=A0A6A5BPV9_NAEFO|nr:uncharacterized protein FDP41_003729 [Naegleria fowleri]KAF0977076.1 hypothetical protein FDP41_003729 [Naegleria fowleri]
MMHHSRFIAFLLSIAAFLLLLLSCTKNNNLSSLVHADYLMEEFKNLSCSGTSVYKEYNPTTCDNLNSGVCQNHTNYSSKRSCLPTIQTPLSPKVGEHMTLFYEDSKCSTKPSKVIVTTLDTCIPASLGSYMIKVLLF